MVRFATVGFFSVGVDFLFLNLFLWLHFEIYVAIFLAYMMGTVNSYIFNTRWTYGHLNAKTSAGGFVRFAFVGIVGLGLTEGIVYLLITFLHAPVNLDKLVAVAAVFFWNFFGTRMIAFNVKTENIVNAEG